MLTTDLLRVRRSKGVLLPRYLKPAERTRLLPAVTELIGVLSESVGTSREELDEKLGALPQPARDAPILAGMRKLLLDRCEMMTAEGANPVAIRAAVFDLATKRRAELEAKEVFDRNALIEEAAAQLELTAEQVEQRLYADLRANEQLVKFRKIKPEALLERYNVSLAQGVLLRASRVVIELNGESPGRVRQLFRAARFHGLLHHVIRNENGSYRIELDGPLSLFTAVNKYGLKLAIFLPEVLRCKKWHLRAEILWGKKRERCAFLLSASDGLKPTERAVKGVAPELQKFVDKFRKLKCSWTVKPNEEIFALPGEAVCVPDLAFENEDTGEVVYLEAFGFWSRQAVWQRIESIRGDFPARLILAVGKQLRVSEELLDESELGELYVYKQSMRPRVVLERLEGAAEAAP